jgi:DNA polymerase-3 subunit delta
LSVELLKKDIKNKSIRTLYMFYGLEEFLINYYIESIAELLIPKDLLILNMLTLEGKQSTDKIIDACETMPVLSERKLVVIKNSGLFKAQKKDKDDSIIKFLNRLPEHICLIFVENEVDKRLKLFTTIKKSGLAVEFAYQKPNALVKWAIKVFKASGKEIDQTTASMLINGLEPGMTDILNEINKLINYLGDRKKVTMQDIETVCTKSIKSRIFDITDAVAEKNPEKAMGLLNDLLMLKEPVQKIYFMITRQLRQVLQVKLLSEQGFSQKEIASQLSLHPFVASKLIKQAAGFTKEKLLELMSTALEMDVAVKSGRLGDHQLATEILIIKMSS